MRHEYESLRQAFQEFGHEFAERFYQHLLPIQPRPQETLLESELFG